MTVLGGSDTLPSIRAELRLVGQRHDASGVRVDIIYDPLRHRFFELDTHAITILRHWRAGSRARLLEAVNAHEPVAVSAADIEMVVAFFAANQLLVVPAAVPPISGFHRIEAMIGKLFFFRIPLLRPDRVLTVWAEVLAPLLRKGAITGFVVAAVVALMLVLRQWDLFVDGLRTAATPGGLISILVTVVMAKIVHELGHALAAKRLGCAVPAMGVAVMFGAPLLYTDLSDTWRLSRRRDRLLVASGGILAELGLAAIATWGWLILPDGPARNACFFLASVAWVATLAVNLNPFLRFDGYFMLSDLLGVPNLQDRSFALARAALRRFLWGWTVPSAEPVSARLKTVLLAYAYSTWGFRAGLYVAMAWTVFTLLPKVIAVPLLAAEMWVLLMRPIFKEIAAWWSERARLLRGRRSRVTLLLAGGFILWLIVPQSFQMELPATVAPEKREWIHPPRPAQLTFHVPEGSEVAEGDVLARFRDPNLDHEIIQSRLHLASLLQTESQAARSQRAARELAVLRERIAEENATLIGLLVRQESLTLRASFAGRVRENSPSLVVGRWQAPSEPLFLLVSHGRGVVTAFVDDRDLALVAVGARATFHPEAVTLPVIPAKIAQVEAIPADTIDEPLLASINGGPIGTERDSAGRAVPRHGQYRVAATLASDAGIEDHAIRGSLVFGSVPYSLFDLAIRRIKAALVKETGA